MSRSNCASFSLSASAPPGPRTSARSVTYRAGFSGSWPSMSAARREAASAAAMAARSSARTVWERFTRPGPCPRTRYWAGAAVGAGWPKLNWTFGACSDPATALKYGFSLKFRKRAMKFVGNLRIAVL